MIPAYIGFFVGGILRREERLFPDRLLLALMICFGFMVVAHLFNPSLVNLIVGFIGVKVWIFYMPLTVLTFHLIDSQQTLNRLIKLMALVSIVPVLVVLVLFLLIYFGYMDLAYSLYGSGGYSFTQRFTRFQIGDQILARIPGVFTSANQNYGFLFSMVVIGSVNVFLKNVGMHKTNISLLALTILSCILCGTRRAFVTIPLFFLFLLCFQRRFSKSRRLVLVIMVTLGTLSYFFSYLNLYQHISKRTAIAYRSEVKERNISSVKEAPLGLGTGMATGPERHAYPGLKG